jgi:hypothetical protein
VGARGRPPRARPSPDPSDDPSRTHVTGIRLTYYDSFYANGAGPGCEWTVLFNGQACVQPAAIDMALSGWVAIEGYCRGTSGGDLGAGPLTVTVRADVIPGSTGTCFTGVDGDAGMLEAEEFCSACSAHDAVEPGLSRWRPFGRGLRRQQRAHRGGGSPHPGSKRYRPYAAPEAPRGSPNASPIDLKVSSGDFAVWPVGFRDLVRRPRAPRGKAATVCD